MTVTALGNASTNDLNMGVDPRLAFNAICALHSECHRHGAKTIALAPPTVSQGPPRLARRTLVTKLSEWARNNTSVAAYLDPERLVPRNDPSFWDSDGIHFSPLGSVHLGQGLAVTVAAVAAVLGTASENTCSGVPLAHSMCALPTVALRSGLL